MSLNGNPTSYGKKEKKKALDFWYVLKIVLCVEILTCADAKQGAPLTEYTLRLIGSDIEHYIRKMLYDGVIKYNMNARVLNFSMGKPRIMFNNNDIQPEDAIEKWFVKYTKKKWAIIGGLHMIVL